MTAERPASPVEDSYPGTNRLQPPDEVVLLAPAYPHPSTGPAEIAFETRLLSSGQPALMAFTEIDKLVGQLGAYQPWIAVGAQRLVDIARTAKVPLVLDPIVDPGVPRWTEQGLRALSGSASGQIEPTEAKPQALVGTTVSVQTRTATRSTEWHLFVTPAGAFFRWEGNPSSLVLDKAAARELTAALLEPAGEADSLSRKQLGEEVVTWLSWAERALDLKPGELDNVTTVASVLADQAAVSASATFVHLSDGRSCLSGARGSKNVLLVGSPSEIVAEAISLMGLEEA
jgi:hypothetical protein